MSVSNNPRHIPSVFPVRFHRTSVYHGQQFSNVIYVSYMSARQVERGQRLGFGKGGPLYMPQVDQAQWGKGKKGGVGKGKGKGIILGKDKGKNTVSADTQVDASSLPMLCDASSLIEAASDSGSSSKNYSTHIQYASLFRYNASVAAIFNLSAFAFNVFYGMFKRARVVPVAGEGMWVVRWLGGCAGTEKLTFLPLKNVLD